MAIESAEVWALFYGRVPAHRMRRTQDGKTYGALCGKVTSNAAQLTENETAKRCKRCAHILDKAR